jgi:PPP family 3-phenylpropionic acid transporter
MYSAALLITMIFIKSIKLNTVDDLTTDPGSMKSGNFKTLLGNRKYMALIWSAFFINGTMIAHNTYFSFLFIQVGGTFSGIGLALLLMVGSEVPMMAWSEKLAKIISFEKLILITMLFSTVRFLWYSTAPSPELLTWTFFFQGIANGILLVMLVKYISRLVDKAIISSAITLYASISSNASSILCLFFGGVILKNFDGAAVYLFYGLFNLVGIGVYVGSGLHKKEGLS